MSSSRRQNGRSPLVNPQRQITSFFSKFSKSQYPSPPTLPKPSSNPNPSITPSLSKLTSKSVTISNPNPNPSHSPTTPSPLNAKSKPKITAAKTPLVIGEHPSADAVENDKRLYGDEVVDRRVRVYWPLDKIWYEGCVKSFNKVSGKHLVDYDDGEEEMLNLSKEKIELLEGSVKKFRRLRRVLVVNEDEGEEDKAVEEDDSADEDWCKNAAAEDVEDCLEDMDLEAEEEEEDVSNLKKKDANLGTKKRKAGGQEKVGLAKKPKEGGETGSLAETAKNSPNENLPTAIVNGINNDAVERFGNREAEKMPFLGKD